MHEKSSYFQGQVATTLLLAELELQIKQSEATEEKALAQVMGCHCHRRRLLKPPPDHHLTCSAPSLAQAAPRRRRRSTARSTPRSSR